MKTINRLITKKKRIDLRRTQTDAEKKLWGRLRNKHFMKLKFYRQQGIGNYIADFWCPDKKIVIEIDGSQHQEEPNLEYDNKRKEYFNCLGIRVVRFNNVDVLMNIDEVLEHLYCFIEKQDDVMKIE
jgi:very-short-patch-repair endonuclease